MKPGERLHGIVLFSLDVLGSRVEGFSDGTAKENRVGLGEVLHSVDIGRGKDISDSVENGMARVGLFDDPAGSLPLVPAVVGNPLFAEDLAPPFPVADRAPEFLFPAKGVRRGAPAR